MVYNTEHASILMKLFIWMKNCKLQYTYHKYYLSSFDNVGTIQHIFYNLGRCCKNIGDSARFFVCRKDVCAIIWVLSMSNKLVLLNRELWFKES